MNTKRFLPKYWETPASTITAGESSHEIQLVVKLYGILKQDSGAILTTMVDYYGLPSTGDRAWPGRLDAAFKIYAEKAASVEGGMLEEIKRQVNWQQTQRFIPFVVMHEFEGLLFSNCKAFAKGICRPDLVDDFQFIRDCFASPEEINDNYETAPSKRIKNLMPDYDKPLLVSLATLEIGLEKIIEECPHFAAWISKLKWFAGRDITSS